MSNPLQMWSTWEHKERRAPSPWCEVMQARHQEIEKGKRCDQQDAQTSVSRTLQPPDMLQPPDVQICFTSLHPDVSDVHQSNGCWAAHFHTSRTAWGAKPHNHEVARSKLSFDTAARTSGKTSKGSRRRCNNTYKTSDIYVRQLVFVCFCFLVLRLRKQTYLIRVDTASSCDLIFVDRSPQEIYGTRALKKALKSTANRFDD